MYTLFLSFLALFFPFFHTTASVHGEIKNQQRAITQAEANFPPFLNNRFELFFLNEQKMPLVLSPKDAKASLSTTKTWIENHQTEFVSLVVTNGALLLRGLPIQKAEDFAAIITSVLGRELIDYIGEGSRKKIIDGVYTSTEAPPQFQIPLHNELSCTNHPPDYICFFCETAPLSNSGQTAIGKTLSVTQEMMRNVRLWNLFYGQNLKYVSRHPPLGSFFTKVNRTHKPWPEVFETNDRLAVEKICKEKGFGYRWYGDWIEVTRIAPAIQNPDGYFDQPYWFNQAHLYHGNPLVRGGLLYHILANVLYVIPSTQQYDVYFEDGSRIPQEMMYAIYDILEQQTIKFDWQQGDVLILDNRKTLHGRAPYSGARRIMAAMVQ